MTCQKKCASTASRETLAMCTCTPLCKNPDLVIMDVELKDGNAFEILEALEKINFKIIFITAYTNYAIDAIKVQAVDYLKKPLNINEFVSAILKVEQELTQQNQLISQANNPAENKQPTMISISTRGGFETINLNNLIRCKADGKYTECHLEEGKVILASKNLKEFENILQDKPFFRVHHGHLVNLNKIKTFHRADSQIEMINNDVVPISQRKKREFMDAVNLI